MGKQNIGSPGLGKMKPNVLTRRKVKRTTGSRTAGANVGRLRWWPIGKWADGNT